MAQTKKKATTPPKSTTASKAAETSTKATKGAKAGNTPAKASASKKATTATKKAAAPPAAPPAPTYKTYTRKDILANVVNRLNVDTELNAWFNQAMAKQITSLMEGLAANLSPIERSLVQGLSEQINVILPRQNISPTQFYEFMSEHVSDALLTEWEGILLQGDQVRWPEWGTMGTKLRAARTGINPHTKEKLEIPAQKVFYFKVAGKLREQIKHGAEEQKAAQA